MPKAVNTKSVILKVNSECQYKTQINQKHKKNKSHKKKKKEKKFKKNQKNIKNPNIFCPKIRPIGGALAAFFAATALAAINAPTTARHSTGSSTSQTAWRQILWKRTKTGEKNRRRKKKNDMLGCCCILNWFILLKKRKRTSGNDNLTWLVAIAFPIYGIWSSSLKVCV